MSAALYGRDAAGINRKIKKLYANVGGVNRELKELWAKDSGGVNRKIFNSFPDQISAQGTGYYYMHESDSPTNYSASFTHYGQVLSNATGIRFDVSVRVNISGGGESLSGTSSSYAKILLPEPLSISAGDVVLHLSNVAFEYRYPDNVYGTSIRISNPMGAVNLLSLGASTVAADIEYNSGALDLVSNVSGEFSQIEIDTTCHYQNSHSEASFVDCNGTITHVCGEPVANIPIDPNVWDYDD